jgi:hypothetical protein
MNDKAADRVAAALENLSKTCAQLLIEFVALSSFVQKKMSPEEPPAEPPADAND